MEQSSLLSTSRSGFSLVEVLAASLIFVLGATASLNILSNSLQSTRSSIEIEESVTLATAAIEQQRSRLLPTGGIETIGDYTQTTTVTGCRFTGTTMSCAVTCDETVPVCEIVVTIVNTVTNETETLTTMKMTERL
ncbi:MAG: prepilin-type N-terminal cleavage/methylation domain-containing protein [Synechococcus sp.]